MNCPKCGSEHNPTNCQGHVVKDPETREPIPPRQCEKRPVKGATVCATHGGRARQVKAKAEERQVEAEADQVLRQLLWNPNAEPVTNAVVELQRLAGSARGALDVLGAQLTQGEVCEACGRGDADLDQPKLLAWQRQQRLLHQVLESMERLGIAERAVELEAARVRLVAVALDRVFTELGLSSEQRASATSLLMVELRTADAAELEVEGGGAA